MRKNMGGTDRLVRSAGAIILIILCGAHAITGIWTILSLILAAYLLFTGISGYEPFYRPLKIDTCCDNCEHCETKDERDNTIH